jgi:threonine/homoserine/homoserine lactone efflux protein
VNWELFATVLIITLILVLTPGPIVTLVIATGASQGIRAALTTVAGTTIGNAVLIAAIAFGLSWILKFSAELFEILRWVGAAYLVWLGIQAWRSAGSGNGIGPPPGRVNFSRGFLVALTNPKTIAFFTAFLPQFVDPSLPAWPQLLVMCVVTVVMAGLTDTGWAVASGLGRAWFLKPTRARLLGRLSGVALIGGGIWLSLTRRPA